MAVVPCSLHNPSIVSFTPNRRLFSIHSVSPSCAVWKKVSLRFQSTASDGLKRSSTREPFFSGRSRGYIVSAINDANSKVNLEVTDKKLTAVDGLEPFRGKSGSVSFIGLTHQKIEEGKLVSAPFKKSQSLLWVFAPIALISSILVPVLANIIIDDLIKDMVLFEIVSSISSEVTFYIGLATFLLVTDRVQKPYLQFSPKRWSLITGLRGYLTSAFLVMGFKVVAPILAVFVTWPLLGLPALVSVTPYLVGCLAQYMFEKVLERRQSSCWPLVPIIFEVYRLYQLMKAMHFTERLMFQMKDVAMSPEVMERSGAFAAMMVTFEVLALLSIWSFLTFVQRLFPSRPVSENY